MKWINHDLNHYKYFTAHTINCVCHCIRSMFRVLGIYNFDGIFHIFELTQTVPQNSRHHKHAKLLKWGCNFRQKRFVRNNKCNFVFPRIRHFKSIHVGNCRITTKSCIIVHSTYYGGGQFLHLTLFKNLLKTISYFIKNKS